MFWSGNYIVVRELKCLLKEENVTLSQILEADDILQECKADNKALIQFLTRPDILAELITLITEEPPKNVELSSQYRHANIASEVLTSNLSMLRDRLSMDATQMNRLCDFVDRDPPLNPLLASYFSKTIEMLLERSPKQDWYLHHIVCLHVLDMFKSRRDFLPNLLRHISTSAISDTFKCFLHLGSPFNKIILEWLDEHQFLESLIQIICGAYDPEEAQAATAEALNKRDQLDSNHNAEADAAPARTEVSNSRTKVAETNGETDAPHATGDSSTADRSTGSAESEARAERVRCVAAFNAAALLCDIAMDAASVDPFNNEWYAGRTIAARLRGEEAVRRLLQGVFTSAPRARHHALVNACRLLLALLSTPPAPPDPAAQDSAETHEESRAAEHGAVERAVAPHLPLLHHALLHDAPRVQEAEGEQAGDTRAERVGAARVSVAALVARLALSEVDDVPTALISLGTAGVLVDMLFRFPHNNFLHAQVCALVRNARANRRFSHRYTAHLIEECNLLTRLMDAFEENEDKKEGGVRAGYMGHVVGVLRSLDAAPPVLSSALQQRWDAFRENKLRPLLQRHDTPLGGIYPWENNMYEVGTTIQVLMDNMEHMADTLDDSYDFNETATSLDEAAEACQTLAEPLAEPLDGLREDPMDRMQQSTKNYFLELVNERRSGFDDELWDDAEPATHALQHDSPWEGAGGGGGAGGTDEGWAQFDAFADPAPGPDPFTPIDTPMMQAMAFWSNSESQEQRDFKQNAQQGGGFEDDDKDALTLLLAQKMLTVFHSMTPAQPDAGDDFQLPDLRAAEHGLQDERHPDTQNEDTVEDSNQNLSHSLQGITDEQNIQSDAKEQNPDVQNPQSNDPSAIPSAEDPPPSAQEEFSSSQYSQLEVLDGSCNVQNTSSNAFEGISSVQNTSSNAFEGISSVQNTSSNAFEGISSVQNTSSNAFEGISSVQNTSSNAFEGISSVQNTSSNAYDAVSSVQNSSSDAFEGISSVQKSQSGSTSENQNDNVESLNSQCTSSASAPSACTDSCASPRAAPAHR